MVAGLVSLVFRLSEPFPLTVKYCEVGKVALSAVTSCAVAIWPLRAATATAVRGFRILKFVTHDEGITQMSTLLRSHE